MAHKLLLVDDEKDVVDILEKRFRQEKFEVASAFDGEEALTLMEEYDPDVILLDLMLPKLSGIDVLRKIREKYSDRWRPVIIVSAKAELESFEKCYSLKADHYLTKPCLFEDMLQGVETMISLIGIRK